MMAEKHQVSKAMIHLTDTRSWPIVIITFTHVSLSILRYSSKLTNLQVEITRINVCTVELAKWIIDDPCLVLDYCQVSLPLQMEFRINVSIFIPLYLCFLSDLDYGIRGINWLIFDDTAIHYRLG